jgi:hypothetical protein
LIAYSQVGIASSRDEAPNQAMKNQTARWWWGKRVMENQNGEASTMLVGPA